MAPSISCRPFVREGRTSRNTGSVIKESRNFVNRLYFVDHLAFLCGLPPERERERDRDREKQRAMGVSSWVVGRRGESSRMWTVAAGPVRTFSVGQDVLEAVVGLVQLLPQLVLLLQHLGQHLQHTPAMCLTPTHQQRV